MKKRVSVPALIFMFSVFGMSIACLILGIWFFPALRLVLIGIGFLLLASGLLCSSIMQLRQAKERGERKPWWKSFLLMMALGWGLWGAGFLSNNEMVLLAFLLPAVILMGYGLFLAVQEQVKMWSARS